MFLYGQEAAPGPAGGTMGPLIMIGIMFVIMYFLIIMPARKKQKQHMSMVDSLEVGKRVITAAGIYGTITRVMEDRFELEVDKDTRIQITKPSIASVVEPQSAEPQKG